VTQFKVPSVAALVLRPDLEPLEIRSEVVPGGIVVWCESGARDFQVWLDGTLVRD
jgi:hypothetical protein